MDDERKYFMEDEEERLIASMSEEEFIEFMGCLAVAINEKRGNERL